MNNVELPVSNTLEYFDWDDLENYFCRCLEIDPGDFRDYKPKGRKLKRDLWHVWNTLVYADVQNDSYKTVWFDVLDWSGAIREYGDSILPFKEAIEKLRNDLVGKEKIIIFYCW